ncbi:TPA: hypothetical protein N2D04_002670 [Clostridium botulinum]|nr:hypothetical protein [Clostridium botulinum]HCL4458551.1 hypothetical protein [Clostridium botulinum]HCL4462463.1 hypothetical protein [Clostridium botulinum]HCL4473522.1 hypothetical protein [Clostridium botulinum]HCL4477112.1 hypothetical protein [Clostridium botulinum]
MILSERDLKFLKDLYFVKILNTKRICRLYNSKKYCYARLKLLKDNNYIKALYKLPSKENVFTLDKEGYKILGYKPIKINASPQKLLMLADFYFYEKRLNPFIKFDNKYYFNYVNRKYILKIDILLKTNTWIFVIMDNEHLEEQLKKIELYYKSKQYKNLFDNFPAIVVVSSNIEKIIKNKISNFQLLDYEKVKKWNYSYNTKKSNKYYI